MKETINYLDKRAAGFHTNPRSCYGGQAYCREHINRPLKSIQTQHHHRITEELTFQGLIITSILKYASLSTASLWSNVQKNMLKICFNFTLKHLSNTLATRKNLSKWCITQSSACSFCLQSETLQHISSSCKSYLEQGRYTWRHDSVLNFIPNT